jgi:hypothetical protein
MRNALVWIDSIASHRTDDAGIEVMIHSPTMSTDPRLSELLALLYGAPCVSNVSAYPSEQSFQEDMRMIARVDPARAAITIHEVNLDGPDVGSLAETDNGIALTFKGTPSNKALNDFLKTTSPGRLFVAVSLPQSADGTVPQNELDRWTSALRRLGGEFPFISFGILNRIGLDVADSDSPDIGLLRNRGFGFLDTVAIVQSADYFIGVMDVFGMLARGAQKPGAYWPLEGGAPGESQSENSLTRMRELLRDDGFGWHFVPVDPVIGAEPPR